MIRPIGSELCAFSVLSKVNLLVIVSIHLDFDVSKITMSKIKIKKLNLLSFECVQGLDWIRIWDWTNRQRLNCNKLKSNRIVAAEGAAVHRTRVPAVPAVAAQVAAVVPVAVHRRIPAAVALSVVQVVSFKSKTIWRWPW
jgi:hypothetical protein